MCVCVLLHDNQLLSLDVFSVLDLNIFVKTVQKLSGPVVKICLLDFLAYILGTFMFKKSTSYWTSDHNVYTSNELISTISLQKDTKLIILPCS